MERRPPLVTTRALPPPAGRPDSDRPDIRRTARAEVFTIPLEDGKFATIPYPMSPQTWELFMQTLKLWQPRLVAAADQQNEA